MPFCRECGKEIQDDWESCPFCSASTTPPYDGESGGVSLQDSVVIGDVSTTINDPESISTAVQSASTCVACGSAGVTLITCLSCESLAHCSVCVVEISTERLRHIREGPYSEAVEAFRCIAFMRLCGSCFSLQLKDKIVSLDDQIKDILSSIPKLTRVHVAPNIPKKKLNNAIKKYVCTDINVQPNEIWILIDFSTFSSGKTGMCVTSKGIFWRELFDDSHCLPWQIFRGFNHNLVSKMDGVLGTIDGLLGEVEAMDTIEGVDREGRPIELMESYGNVPKQSITNIVPVLDSLAQYINA